MNHRMNHLSMLLIAISLPGPFQPSAAAAELDSDTPPWIEYSATWTSTRSWVYYDDCAYSSGYNIDYNSDYGGSALKLNRVIPVNDPACFYRWDYVWLIPYTLQTPGICTYYDCTSYSSSDVPAKPRHVYGFDDIVDTWFFSDYLDDWDSYLQSAAVLHTGGKAGSSGAHLVSLYARAFTHEGDVRWLTDSPEPWPLWEISPFLVSISGETLDSSGYRYLSLADNSTLVVTPLTPYSAYVYTIVPTRHELVSRCLASTPSNRSRTTIGVGEEVELWFEPGTAATVSWHTSAGSVQPPYGSLTLMTAPSNGVPTVVTATLPGNAPVTRAFSVMEPAGIDHGSYTGSPWPIAPGIAGACMTVRVVLAPASVSFYRVQIKEGQAAPSGRWGYYVNHTPPSHPDWDVYRRINEDNSWVTDDTCQGAAPPPYEEGGFHWAIPAVWRVGDAGLLSPFSSSWIQLFTLGANGTYRIDKFGTWVQRTILNTISHGP